jgi:hypothetical protein
MPFFATPNIQNKEILFNSNGVVNVGMSSAISQCWLSNSSNLTIPINHIPELIEKNNTENKILIDSVLPTQYLNSISIDKENNKVFTTDPQNAAIYLHLCTYITPLLIDCMATGIPIVTLKSLELQELINYKACIILSDIKVINNPKFLNDILNFPNLKDIISNAKIYISDIENNFVDLWTKVLTHVSGSFYIRG